jgi:hypothetical protein
MYLLVCLILALAYPRPLSVPRFNQLVNTLYAQNDTTDHVYTVTGYYTDETRPMLVADLSILKRNFLLPDSSYILLSGPGIDSIAATRADRISHKPPSAYESACVEIRVSVKLPYHQNQATAPIPKPVFRVDRRPGIVKRT